MIDWLNWVVCVAGALWLARSLRLRCRFLRYVPVVYVDYPGKQSLMQIYGTFNRAMMRLVPSLRPYSEPLTSAMVEFYLLSQVTVLSSLLSSLLARPCHRLHGDDAPGAEPEAVLGAPHQRHGRVLPPLTGHRPLLSPLLSPRSALSSSSWRWCAWCRAWGRTRSPSPAPWSSSTSSHRSPSSPLSSPLSSLGPVIVFMAMMRLVPSLRPYSEPLTSAMVEFYLLSQVTGLSSPRSAPSSSSWRDGLSSSSWLRWCTAYKGFSVRTHCKSI